MSHNRYLQQEALEWLLAMDEETTDGYLEELENSADTDNTQKAMPHE